MALTHLPSLIFATLRSHLRKDSKFLEKKCPDRRRWLTLEITASLEAEIRRIMI
jgi:hypothetical protein